MVIPAWRSSAWTYYGTVIFSGMLAIFFALEAAVSVRPADWSWLLLAVPLVLLHRTYVQLPNCDGRICPSGLFVLYAGLEWGPAQATLLAVVDAAFNSVQQTALGFWRLLFNLAALPVAIFLAMNLAWLVRDTGLPGGLEFFIRSSAATLLYYSLNLGLVLGMMALTSGRAAVAAVRSALLWSWAGYLVGGVAAALLTLWGADLSVAIVAGAVVLVLSCRTLQHYFGVLREREVALGDKERLLKEKETLLEEVRATHLATLETLAMAIEAKDPPTHGHIRRVQRLAVALGERLNLAADELEMLRIAALVHDIGKLAIPEYLLYRSGNLTPEDEEKLQSHARLGADILRHSRLDPRVLAMVRHHHERFDGRGYPFGLAGEETILGARVLAVANTYDKLRHPRTGEPLSRTGALGHILAESGAGFDPRVVQALCGLEEAVLELVDQEGAGSSPAWSTSRAAARPSFVSDFFASHQEARALYALNEHIRSTPELEPALRLLAGAIREVVPFTALLVYLPEAAGGELALAYSEGVNGPQLEALSACRWPAALRAGREARGATPPLELPIGIFGLDGCVILPFPLSAVERGAVMLGHGGGFAYGEEQRRIVSVLLKEAGPAIANACYYERFRRESLTDALTGLANCRALREQGPPLIAGALRDGRTGCVVVLDLNGFKQINDTLGHHHGDRLLVEAARAMAGQARSGELVARNGGDEFIMVLPDTSRETISLRLVALGEQVGRLWPADWEPGLVGISFGVAWFPEEGQSLERLMEQADHRMYLDKRSRKTLLRLVGRAAGVHAG